MNPNIGSGSGNGNCRIFDTQETKYMNIFESYLRVDSTIIYWEIADDIRRDWKIIDGNIIYVDSFSVPNHNPPHAEGSYYIYILDSTVIVADTTYYDAHLFKMHASGNKSFDQIWAYHIVANLTLSGQIVVEFYSNNALLVEDRKWWYSKNN